MKSTEGQYYPNLDHIRAVAAFLVFAWHFAHFSIPVSHKPSIYLLAIVDEGHCGVSLFMVLSGYLFAKLLTGRSILISAFYYNRLLRLVPLLIAVLIVAGMLQARHGVSLLQYLIHLPLGLVLPTWPAGAWSITTELHFYILLPLLLWLLRDRPLALVGIVLTAMAFRLAWWVYSGSVQEIAYYTILGRIDQFLFGMLACRFAGRLKGRHLVATSSILIFLGYYYWFDMAGGFQDMPSYPSPSAIWIIMPTIEALAFSIFVAWYDQSFSFRDNWLSRTLALVGTVSYSIYLLHDFLIKTLTRLYEAMFGRIGSIEEALVASLFGFALTVPVAWVSYKLIELPFLKFRVRYLAPGNPAATPT